MARRWPCCSSKRTDEADTLMQELATRHPEDLFVVDALTDIDLAKGRSAQAIARLERFRTRMPDNGGGGEPRQRLSGGGF